ncbi:TlpA family protein disulfide reductase [Spirosoma agri]|uniref:TlpA family protein disulfide reductase n=1 Tax=Spirosoma agri TaxID=1987381 RepID=A0A6M0INY2_9BACT|nr:TlpA disulfide reductase family protein [Spirosoma agri]NEU70070.1 TlpA family protein disulfide reductase [Spirosoma agri]
MKTLCTVVAVLAVAGFVILKYFHIDLKVGTNDTRRIARSPFVEKHLEKPLPEFTLKDMTGKTIRSQDLVGKRVHLNFWSTSCKPCIEEFVELNRLKAQYASDYVFLALAPDDSSRVSRTLRTHALRYQVIPNAGAYLHELGVDAYPKNFFVDSHGLIRRITGGSQKELDGLTLVNSNYRSYKKILDAIE